MVRRVLVVLLLLAVPGFSFGQAAGEKFLSANSLLYLRWDGIDAHRDAFDKTACGKMLQGDTGKFLNNLWEFIDANLDTALAQLDPAATPIARQVIGALGAIGKNGFSMAIDVRKINPPEVEATFIFPKNGGPKGQLSGMVKKVLEITGANTKTIKVGGISAHRFSMPPLEWAFGSDADTAIMVVGTVDPASVLGRANNQEKNISSHPLFKELKEFKEFPVWSVGFVDTAGMAKSASDFSPQVARLIKDLGLDGVKSVLMYSGFDGPAERSVVDIHMPEGRKGLLGLTRGKTFSLKDLPPLPDDITSFSASTYDMPGMYDTLVGATEAGVRVFSPDAADLIKFSIRQAENLAGINVRDELLGSLDGLVVSYNSPSESALLGLGSMTLIQVKDEKKLARSLNTLLKAAPQIPLLEFEARRKKYRGVELIELHTKGGYTTPTLCIHKGWLAYANYPQTVQGYVLRSSGGFPTWKADLESSKAFAQLPKEFTGVSYSDPRPGLKFALSLVPPVMSGVNGVMQMFLPGSKEFDVSSVPHPLEASQHLFPNISVTIDDGKKIRYDSRASLALPF